MRLLLPMTVIAIALGMAAVSLLGGDPGGACLKRSHAASKGEFVSVAQRHPSRLILEYDDGLRIDVPRNPQRIVSTAPGITEMIAFLRGLDRLVAVSEHCDRPSLIHSLPKISVLPLSVERLLELNPDLVVLDRRLHRANVAEVRKRVPHVLLLDTSRSLADLRKSFEVLAEVLDNSIAIDLAARWTEQSKRFETLIQGNLVRPPPRVLLVAQWQPLYVLARGSLLDDLVRACGCVNLACDMRDTSSGTFSEELVLERKPDWIFSVAGAVPKRLRDRWSTIPALQESQVLDVSGRDFERGGPGTLRALRVMAERLLGLQTADPEDPAETGEPTDGAGQAEGVGAGNAPGDATGDGMERPR